MFTYFRTAFTDISGKYETVYDYKYRYSTFNIQNSIYKFDVILLSISKNKMVDLLKKKRCAFFVNLFLELFYTFFTDISAIYYTHYAFRYRYSRFNSGILLFCLSYWVDIMNIWFVKPNVYQFWWFLLL